MIPYGKQTIDKNDINSVVKVLKSDWLTQGPAVSKFEADLAKYCGAKYAVAVSNGTVALLLSYLVAGVKPGDEVITTPNTFVATTNMLLALGAKPVFCDIRLDTYNIDESKIEQLITKKTKALVPVNFAGQPVELNKIKTIAKKYKLILIEDGCHSLGAEHQGKKVGSISDMTIFSFHPVKSIATGEGGAILTNNKKLYDKLKLLRSHGITKDKKGFNVMTELGYNFRISDIQSALGVSQLKKINSFISKRRILVKKYQERLKDVSQIVLPKEIKGNFSSWHLYVIRTKNPADRLPLYKYLLSRGIGVNFHYPAVYSHPYYRRHGYQKTKLINDEVYVETAITIPLFPTLSDKDHQYICDQIKKFFS